MGAVNPTPGPPRVLTTDAFGAGTHFDVGYPVKGVYRRIFIRHRRPVEIELKDITVRDLAKATRTMQKGRPDTAARSTSAPPTSGSSSTRTSSATP